MFRRLLERLARELTRAGIDYMVVGGQAVLLYGEPRFTRDIDVTLGIGSDELASVLSVIARMGLKTEVADAPGFVQQTMVLPAVEKRTGIQVDFIFSFTPFERQAIDRARRVRVGKTLVRFAKPEDVIILKVFSGRPRDLEDVRAILLKNRRLDLGYVRKWLAEFDRTPGTALGKRFARILNATARPV